MKKNNTKSSRKKLSKKKTIDSCLVQVLTDSGFKQYEIAKLIEKHPSYVAHVKGNRLSFELEDLKLIEHGTRLPVFWFCSEVAHGARIPKRLKSVSEAGNKFFVAATLARRMGEKIFKK